MGNGLFLYKFTVRNNEMSNDGNGTLKVPSKSKKKLYYRIFRNDIVYDICKKRIQIRR